MKWSDKSNPFRRMEQRKTVFITVVYIITMFFLMSHKWQKKKRKEIRRNFSLTMQCFIDTLLDRYMSTVSKRSLETHHNVVRRIDWFVPSFFYKKLRILLCVAVCNIRELSRRTSQLLARNIPAGIYFFH